MTKTSFEADMTPQAKDELMSQLMALLDRIELEEDWQLTHQRFDIMREYGDVVFGMPSSAMIN